jgi:hypothetical protein
VNVGIECGVWNKDIFADKFPIGIGIEDILLG